MSKFWFELQSFFFFKKEFLHLQQIVFLIHDFLVPTFKKFNIWLWLIFDYPNTYVSATVCAKNVADNICEHLKTLEPLSTNFCQLQSAPFQGRLLLVVCQLHDDSFSSLGHKTFLSFLSFSWLIYFSKLLLLPASWWFLGCLASLGLDKI